MGVQDNEGVNRELKAGFHMITDDRRSETIADARGGGELPYETDRDARRLP